MRIPTRAAAAACAAGTLVGLLAPIAPAQADTVTATIVQSIQTSNYNPPSPDSSGIVWNSLTDRLMMVDSEVEEMSIYKGVNFWEINRAGGTVARTGDVRRFTKEPTGIGFDPNPADPTVFISDDDAYRINIVKPGPDGKFATGDDPVTFFDAKGAGDTDPEGVAFDRRTGELYLGGGTTKAFYRVGKGADGKFGTSDDIHGTFDVGKYGQHDMEGIAYDWVRDTIVTFDVATRRLYELTKTGSLVRIIDISAISPKGGGDVALAPASNGSGRLNYWVVLRGVDNNATPSENDGKLFELSIPGSTAPPPTNQAPTVAITAPADGASFPSGSAVTLTGTASDPEDGSLTSGIIWSSSRDGTLGTGGSITRNLGDGTHVVTASVTDSGGTTRSATISVTLGTTTPPPPTSALPPFTAVADASLYKDTPTTGYGTAQTVETDNSPVKRYLLKFEVTGFPAGATAASVELRLSCTNSSSKGGDVRLTSTSDWTDSASGGVTWSTQPAFDAAAAPLASMGSVASGNVYTVTLPGGTITGNGTYSFVVTSTSSDGADYWSREKGGTFAPQLLVTVS